MWRGRWSRHGPLTLLRCTQPDPPVRLGRMRARHSAQERLELADRHSPQSMVVLPGLRIFRSLRPRPVEA